MKIQKEAKGCDDSARKSRLAFRRRIHDLICSLADGHPHSRTELVDLMGADTRVLSVIPWLDIEWHGNKFIIKIDQQLKEICDGDRRRPELNNLSIREFLHMLNAEISRRRKENNDEYMKRRWNPDAIAARDQSTLLDWIEDELRKIKL